MLVSGLGWHWGVLQFVELLALVVDLAEALNLTHVGHSTGAKDEVEVSEAVESSSLALVEDHPVFVDAGIGAKQKHDIA